MQGVRRMAISLHHAQHAWVHLASGSQGTTMEPPMGSPAVAASQHSVRTPAGSYTFQVTEYLPPLCSDAATPGEEQTMAGRAPGTGLARPAASGGGAAVGAGLKRGVVGDDVAGRPRVAFLHGFLGAGGDWAAVAGALALTCRCWAVDLPGHGGSRALSGITAGGALSIPSSPFGLYSRILPLRFGACACGLARQAAGLSPLPVGLSAPPPFELYN